MHYSAACTWAAPSSPQASAPRSTRSPNWHPTYWYPDTAPAGEHNTPSPLRYPTAGSKAAAAPATSSPLPYLPGGRTWPVRDMAPQGDRRVHRLVQRHPAAQHPRLSEPAEFELGNKIK